MVILLEFFIILSILILVHEGGHFLAAKKAGVLVEEFGFGLPPRLFGKKIGETLYSLNALPFGGFVRLYGEETAVKKNKKRAFSSKTKRVRIGILSAGIIMNLLLGTLAFCLVYSFLGIPEKDNQVRVLKVEDNSPARQGGIITGDILLNVNGQRVKNNQKFIDTINQFVDQPVTIKVWRQKNNKNFFVVLVPRSNPPEGQGSLGVIISDTQVKFYPFYQMIPKAIYSGFAETFFWTRQMLVYFGKIGKSILAGKGIKSLGIAGPVGIYQITGQVAKSGIWALVQFTGILSINLAIFNIIPFPALDGGRIAFVFLENFLGAKKREKIESWANRAGMAILLLFFLLVTINDIKRIKISK